MVSGGESMVYNNIGWSTEAVIDGNLCNVNISEMIRADAKMSATTFVDFNICYQVALLQNCTP